MFFLLLLLCLFVFASLRVHEQASSPQRGKLSARKVKNSALVFYVGSTRSRTAWARAKLRRPFWIELSSPGQTIATCQRNISQHCCTGATCCVRLATVLRHVGCCWLKFETGQFWANNAQHVATRYNRVAKHNNVAIPNVVLACCYRLAGALTALSNSLKSFLTFLT